MTVKNVVEEACALLSMEIEEADDMMAITPHLLNVLFREVYTTEKRLREYKGLEQLLAPFEVAAWDGLLVPSTVIPYQPELCAVALAYGLAAQLADDDDPRSRLYRNRYIEALNEAMRVKTEAITDLY